MCPAPIGPGQPPWECGSTHTSRTQAMHTACSHEGGPSRRARAGVETGPFRDMPGSTGTAEDTGNSLRN
jgi:hypothetical protein